MNAIRVMGNYVQMTTTNHLLLIVVACMFGMVCVYKLVTSERWYSMLVGVALLIAAFVLLAGCAPADPMNDARAQELANRSAIALSQNNASIEAGQQSDREAALERERLRQMQSEQAILASQQAIAQAQANVQIAATIAKAAKPDYGPLYVLVFMVPISTLVLVLFWLSRKHPRMPPSGPKLLPSLPGATAWLLPDGTVLMVRERDGKSLVIEQSDPIYNRLLTG